MVELRDLRFHYPGAATQAVDGLSLEIPLGAVTALMGANGSGKSTLARLLTGLLTPDRGTICINGVCPDHGPTTLENCIGLVRQDPRDQLIATLVDEEVAFGPEYLLLPREEIRRRVNEALKRVGLEGTGDRAPESFSAGQQQRLAIAGILAMRPDYLIFDEAASMLDPAGRSSFYALCRELAEDGYGILTITHFADEALHADRLILLSAGRVEDQGTPRDLLRRRPSLGRPYCFALSESLRRRGIDLPSDGGPEELARRIAGLLAGGAA